MAVLDPFGTSGWQSSSYNPFDELDPKTPSFIDDVSLVADALIVGDDKDRHWTDSAKSLIRCLILYMYASSGEVTLDRLRKILLGAEGKLMMPDNPPDDLNEYLFIRISAMPEFDGLLSLAASSVLEKNEREFSSVLSTAREQLSFLDSSPLAAVLASSALRLNTLKRQPTTIYLCLPATRLATHFRWLRLVIQMGFIELERDRTVPKHPVLFLLEEFSALGYMKPIEHATGFMAGFGVRLWSILQDLTQLKTHYPKSWETFLGNAGIIQAFGNLDVTTTEHLSKMIGNTRVIESQNVFISGSQLSKGDNGQRENIRSVRLLEADEITRYFARETNRQLIIVPGSRPLYLNRLPPEQRRQG